MPPKRLRLPAEELKDVRSFAKRSSPLFVVRRKQNGLPHPRFAVIVSAKADRSSVGRNRLKRRAYEHLRLRAGSSGLDVIVTVLPPAKGLSRTDFLQELDKLIL